MRPLRTFVATSELTGSELSWSGHPDRDAEITCPSKGALPYTDRIHAPRSGRLGAQGCSSKAVAVCTPSQITPPQTARRTAWAGLGFRSRVRLVPTTAPSQLPNVFVS